MHPCSQRASRSGRLEGDVAQYGGKVGVSFSPVLAGATGAGRRTASRSRATWNRRHRWWSLNFRNSGRKQGVLQDAIAMTLYSSLDRRKPRVFGHRARRAARGEWRALLRQDLRVPRRRSDQPDDCRFAPAVGTRTLLVWVGAAQSGGRRVRHVMQDEPHPVGGQTGQSGGEEAGRLLGVHQAQVIPTDRRRCPVPVRDGQPGWKVRT